MMLNNFLTKWILFISICMALSSNFWFALWMSLEVNMLIFIPMMNSKNFLSSNSMINYYIIQSVASSIFFFSSLLYPYMNNNNMIMCIIMMTILIKLGSAPFHSWFPQISEGLKMNSFFILSTFQKIIPLHIMSIVYNKYLYIFIFLSAMISSLGGLNQFSMKKILAFSSITHLSWMMSLILINQNFWLIYFFVYTIINYKIINFLMLNKISNINNIYLMKMTFFNKVLMLSYFLSLGGMPPFLGFFSKWISIILISKKMIILLIILIMSSLINLFFYIRIMFPLIMNINVLMKNSIKFINLSKKFFILNFLGIFLFSPLIMNI
uniref:NADH dehydrogenase subunit 2 n=1 Tax=Ixodes trianguliceps TaxID=347913 RepID=UPI0030FE9491